MIDHPEASERLGADAPLPDSASLEQPPGQSGEHLEHEAENGEGTKREVTKREVTKPKSQTGGHEDVKAAISDVSGFVAFVLVTFVALREFRDPDALNVLTIWQFWL